MNEGTRTGTVNVVVEVRTRLVLLCAKGQVAAPDSQAPCL